MQDQALRKEVVALRARVVVLPEIAAWAWIAKLDGEDWDAGVTLGAEQPNLQAPVEGVTYDYAPLIGLKPLARLNGKVVSEGLLRKWLELMEHGDFREGHCMCGSAVDSHGIVDGHAPVDAGEYYAGQVMEELRDLLGEGKEVGDVLVRE